MLSSAVWTTQACRHANSSGRAGVRWARSAAACVLTLLVSLGVVAVVVPAPAAYAADRSFAARTATTKLVAVSKVPDTHLRSGAVLASADTRLKDGRAVVRLVVTDAAARAVRRGDVTHAKLVIVTRDGTRTARIVTLR
jgi:hypothetical protein